VVALLDAPRVSLEAVSSRWLIVVVLASCQGKDRAPEPSAISGSAVSHGEPKVAAVKLPDPLPGAHKDVSAWVGSAARAAIGDLDGDHVNEIVLIDQVRLRIVTPAGREIASVQVPGGIQVLVVTDFDGDARAEILAGYGLSREHKDAGAQVVMYRLEQGHLAQEIIVAPKTTRNEISDIVPLAGEKSAIVIGYFESKYIVHSLIARRTATAWTLTDVASIRMATSYASGDIDGDGKPDLVVGRDYGDDKGIDGDAFVLASDGKRIAIPTTRGVRGLAIADLDGDGHAELYLADGWHQNYAQSARGLVTWIRHGEHGFTSELIEDMAGQFSAGRLLPAKIDGHAALVTSGNLYVRVFTRAKDRWKGLTIAPVARDIAVGDLDGVAGDEVLSVGDHSEIISLEGAL
jgi:hypothetical protein